MAGKKRKPCRDGRVHVQHSQCSTCIFRPGNPMHLERGVVAHMVTTCEENGGVIPCHKTLDGLQSVCRGFYDLILDSPAQHLHPLCILSRLGLAEFTGGQDAR